MGLFDIFKKKSQDETPADTVASSNEPSSSRSPWPNKFQGFRNWDDNQKKSVGIDFLNDMGTFLDNPKVKEMLDEDDLELRGRYDGIPLRVQYEMDMGWVSLEMKCQSAIEDLSLEWDLEKVPVDSENDDDDDWDDDDEVRVFLGKGVFIEGDKNEVNNTLAQFASLPTELQAEIVETIQNLRLTRFYVYSQSISVGFDDNSYEMANPAAAIESAVSLMAKTAKATATGEFVVGQTTTSGQKIAITPVNLVTCSYCRTKFNLGGNSRCPNCGASYTCN